MTAAVRDRALPAVVWTVGHSTRDWEAFLQLLATHRIEAVADVRRFPGSRRYPWFAEPVLRNSLPDAGLEYLWLPQLGGRRTPLADSPNGAWRNAAFQGYADHMGSAEFADGLGQAMALALRRRTALMCAEALWWHCHRRLISDLLVHRCVEVLHVVDEKPAQPHEINPDARADGDGLVYPPAAAAQGSLF